MTPVSAQGQAIEPTFTKIYVQPEPDISVLYKTSIALTTLAYIYIQINSRARHEGGKAESARNPNGPDALSFHR
jgi:hypothetical protein